MNIEFSQHQKDKMSEYGIPGYMQDGLIQYFENRIPPGSFLTAVLENDLMGALGKADDTNRFALHAYGTWLFNQAPGRPNGWGSPEAVRVWLNPVSAGQNNG